MKSYSSVDEYIDASPVPIQDGLRKLRQTIKKAAPEAQEKISYGIPTFTFHGNLIHFAGYDTHYGLYPGAQAIVEFADELKTYETSKGTIRFPLDKPIPLDLVKRITKYRVEATLQRKKANK